MLEQALTELAVNIGRLAAAIEGARAMPMAGGARPDSKPAARAVQAAAQPVAPAAVASADSADVHPSMKESSGDAPAVDLSDDTLIALVKDCIRTGRVQQVGAVLKQHGNAKKASEIPADQRPAAVAALVAIRDAA